MIDNENDNVIQLHKNIDGLISKYDAQSIELDRRSKHYFLMIDVMEIATNVLDQAIANVYKAEASLKELLDEIGDEDE